MSYLERIANCNTWSATHYLPWKIAGETYGWLRPQFVEHLTAFPDCFVIHDYSVALHPDLNDYAKRSAAIAPVLRQLHEQGVIDTWVNERYPVNHAFGEQGVLEVERAATNYFGTKSYGVHLNGLVKKADGIYVWTGVRARDKPFFSGKLDQVVAGGQPVGISLMDNLIKESAEEANIPAILAEQAVLKSQLSYRQATSRGLDQSTLYNFDLWLPEDFIPENTDGEVEAFHLYPISKIAELTEHSEAFKDNCNLTNIDLLLRLGVISAQHPDYTAIKQQLYR
ncbi:MAG TPA: DUF4743 domain-containing protein [Thiothrix sp.]|nr:DUF4743 domain-containing protein [Thiothrix sp.]